MLFDVGVDVDADVAATVALATLDRQQGFSVTTSIPEPTTHQSVMLEDTKKEREKEVDRARVRTSMCV